MMCSLAPDAADDAPPSVVVSEGEGAGRAAASTGTTAWVTSAAEGAASTGATAWVTSAAEGAAAGDKGTGTVGASSGVGLKLLAYIRWQCLVLIYFCRTGIAVVPFPLGRW